MSVADLHDMRRCPFCRCGPNDAVTATEQQALAHLAWREAVWAVLVEECGARGDQRGMHDDFKHHFPQCREFRFQGSLGFGGKVYSTAHAPYLWVDCYPEDRTDERADAIRRANGRLAALVVDRVLGIEQDRAGS